jgi:hypothetical protein
MLFRLSQEQLDIGMGAKAENLKAIGQMFNDFKAVGSDGAGGTEYDQAARVLRRGMAVGGGHDDVGSVP